MSKFFALAALSLITFFATRGNAYAYVDPGTGGMFYQIVILVFAVVAGYFAVFKRFIMGIFKKDRTGGETGNKPKPDNDE